MRIWTACTIWFFFFYII